MEAAAFSLSLSVKTPSPTPSRRVRAPAATPTQDGALQCAATETSAVPHCPTASSGAVPSPQAANSLTLGCTPSPSWRRRSLNCPRMPVAASCHASVSTTLLDSRESCAARIWRNAISDLVWNPVYFGISAFRHLAPSSPPPARQSQEVTCRQTRSPSRHRQHHCHLELVLLAPLPTLLARHGESVPALFRKDSVVDNPGHNRLAGSHHRRHLTLDGVQQSLVAPKRPGQKVTYWVPRCPHPARVETRILEPDRFALARRQRSSAIVFKWKLAGPDARAVHSAGPLTPPGRAHLDVFAWDGSFVRNDCTSLSTVNNPKAAAGRCAGSV